MTAIRMACPYYFKFILQLGPKTPCSVKAMSQLQNRYAATVKPDHAKSCM
ncbi:putative flavin-containing monooxygenase [Roseibium sp. TrichSKD4]|nr:putative flavin-containing monooxygenase [Roseibium sp. TrichSKD4]